MNNNLGDIFVILDRHRRLTRLDGGRLAEELVKILAEEVRESMDAEQAPDGTRWDDLSESYGAWKADHHPGKPMGELTGRLKAAVDDLPDGGGVRVVFDRMYVALAPGDPELRVYATAFNDGVPEHNLPARPLFGFSDRCRERMASAIREYLAAGLEGR